MSAWAKLKVVDLKAELKRRGLSTNGLKGELVERLDAADEGSEAGQDDKAALAVEDTPTTEAALVKGKTDDVNDTGDENGDVTMENGAVEVPAMEATENNAPQGEDQSSVVEQATSAPIEDTAAQETNLQPSAVVEMETSSTIPQELPVVDAPPTEETFLTSDDGQKRKRRSQSPPPSEETLRKRLRATEGDASIAPDVKMVDEEAPLAQGEDSKMHDDDDEPAPQGDIALTRRDTPERTDEAMDYGRTISPAVHHATTSLYISNLMRPLRPDDIRAHLTTLATPPTAADEKRDIIVDFFLDQIRTHCFVTFDSISAASRVRAQLHDTVWPNESNRKALNVDFVPPDKVQDWVQKEESAGRAGPRYEIIYREGPDGAKEASLEVATSGLQRPPAGPSDPNSSGNRKPSFSGNAPTNRRPSIPGGSVNNIPVGPRAFRDLNPPTGPRPKRSGPGPRPGAAVVGPALRTRGPDALEYRLVDEELARRRLRNMRSHFDPRAPRRGRNDEINRYSFEDGHVFVDRGKEVFEGIRPPHRERAMRGRGRWGGGGGGGGGGGRRRGGGGGGRDGGREGFRPRSDRYIPGASSGGGGGGGRRLSPSRDSP